MSGIQEKVAQFIREWEDPGTDYVLAQTSGSTGSPKQIRLSKELMKRSAQRSIDFFGLNQSSRIHLALSPEYIAGKMLIVRALLAKCRLTFEEPSQFPLRHDMDQTPIRLLSLVGAQLPGYIEIMKANPSLRVEHLLVGGAPLTQYQRTHACSGDWIPWESYGMTETASHIALRKITLTEKIPFEVLPGIRVMTDEDGALVIDLGSDGIIHTNDIANLLDDTHFTIIGRKDNVIITGGHKVFPEKVEAIISPYLPSGHRFFIGSRASKKWGQEILLYLEGPEIDLPDFHRLGLRSYEIPRDVVYLSSIPATSSGKIIRTAQK